MLTKLNGQWESLCDEQPNRCLAVHPSRRWAAMQVFAWHETSVERAAVWNRKTKKIVWDPGNASALGWIPAGDEILVLRESYAPENNHQAFAPTRPHAEFTYSLERRSWPERDLIGSLPLQLPRGRPVAVVPSPCQSLACVVWRDLGEAGVELVSWERGRLRQRLGRGYFGSSNLLEGVAFSPDGRYFVLAYGLAGWWSDDPDSPSEGGDLCVGWVVIGSVAGRKPREIEVVVPVKPGWLPEDPDNLEAAERLPTPVFLDNEHFRIITPTGKKLVYSVENDS